MRIALGSDTLHGLIWQEMRVLTENGFTPMQALRAGTINGAELCGVEDKLGTLEKGKLADIIAVNGNPLDDFAVMENVPFVMKAGKVHYSPTGIV